MGRRRTMVMAAAAALAMGGAVPVAVGQAQTPCGGLLQPKCPDPPPTPPTTTTPTPTDPAPVPTPAPTAPLSATDFAAVQQSFSAGATFDAKKVTAGTVRTYLAACRAAGHPSDLALAARASCLSDATASAAVTTRFDCDHTFERCQRSLDGEAGSFQTAAGRLRNLNREIDRAVDDTSCRAAMRTSGADLKILDRLVHAFQRVASAFHSRDRARLRAALKALDKVDLSKARSNTARLKAFRKDCV